MIKNYSYSFSKIVFWQKMPSPHQLPVLDSLAKSNNFEVYWVTEDDLSVWRTEMGWQVKDFGEISLFTRPTRELALNLLNKSGPDSVHVFSPDIKSNIILDIFKAACKKDTVVGLMSEAANGQGIAGILRAIIARCRKIELNSKIKFILSMGVLGRRWFESSGWPSEKIFDYAYVVEGSEGRVDLTDAFNPNDADRKTFRFIYVGQIIKRKGLDMAITALSHMIHEDWELIVIGDGNQQEILQQRVSDLGISKRISFLGNLSNTEARNHIKSSDTLILPSRFDGWGAVVNEALMSGVPVICSDRCGAADLVKNSNRGQVFKAADIQSLKQALSCSLDHGIPSPEARESIRSWSGQAVSGDAVAAYLCNILQFVKMGGPRPVAPWNLK